MRGAALPMVLLSLGLVAALSVGGAFVARRYAADGRLQIASSAVEPAVEQALVMTASQADTAVLRGLPPGTSKVLAMPGAPISAGLITRVWVTRLASTTYIFVGEVETTSNPMWRKRLGLLARLDSMGLRPLQGRPWSQLP